MVRSTSSMPFAMEWTKEVSDQTTSRGQKIPVCRTSSNLEEPTRVYLPNHWMNSSLPTEPLVWLAVMSNQSRRSTSLPQFGDSRRRQQIPTFLNYWTNSFNTMTHRTTECKISHVTKNRICVTVNL